MQPTITDAALQTIAQTIKQQKPNTAWVPKTVRKAVGWKNVENNADLQAWATLSDSGAEGDAADELVADVHLLTLNGEAVADLLGVRLAKLAGREPKRFFHTVWKPQLRANESSPPPQVSAKAIGARLPDLTPEIATETGANTRQGLLAGLEELSSQYAVHAVLGDNAQRFAVGQVLTTDDFAATLAISENKRRLLNRLLVIASEEGSLKLTADGWRVARTPQSFSFAQHIRSLISAHPEGRPELTLVQRCGEQLTAVLRGEIDPLSLLFPAEGAGAADLYRYSAGSVALNRMVAEAVAEIAAHLPVGRALRVLEIGAGSGATTGEVLRRVGVERIRYVFTDVAAGFFGAAKLRLLEQDNLTYQTLDIERDPRQQGFELGAFDVVVAANVLHATADLSQAVANAHRLLAPGGQLLLIEGTTPTQWLDITFGMTEGWWRFTDHRLRPDYPLLGVDAWRDVLSRAGLSEFACESPVATSVGESPENAVMIATASASSVPVSVSGNYTILHWEPESADAIVEELRSRGATVDSHCLGSTVRRARISDLLPKRTAGEVVVIPPEVNADAASAESLVGGLLTVLQAVADWEGAIGDEATVSRSVTVITRNAQLPSPQSGAEPISTGHAAVAGMVRAAARELPGVSFRIVDVPHQPFDASAIADEVLNGDATEAEVALRCSGRFVRRLVDGSPAYQSGEARQLRIADRGAIDSLKIATTRRRNPGRGEVLIRVVAAGLNFRDLWNTLGRYPGEPPLGAELSGVVEQIGQGVEDLAVGDGVIAVAGDSIADFVTTPAESVLRLPQAIDMASAATLPVAFGTAALAIEQLAATKPGDRVLIHTATGGVGTAALQLAAARGAEVFATASLGKHRLLRQQGFQHVYDSRCDTFADEVLADTNRHGVDVIVNTLGEERFDANLKALAQGGVYVDLTKPDSNLADKFAKLRPDAEYHLVDLARDWEEDPPKIRQLLEPILTRVASGELDSLPFQAFDLRAAKQAFRTMQQATHIGKLIVTPNERAAARQPDQLKAGEACLITGGFGDLGLLTARWFAEQGMGVIGLVGRGEPSRTALETIQQLEANGVRILPLRADVSDENQLAEAITEVRSTGAALTAVVHSAGTLDDGLLQDQSTQKIAAVFAGKAHGLWNLHRLTKGDPLKRFVAYSSVASVFGAPGQANHATANAFMDAVIDQRRAEGRCGLAINWGPWQAIGEAARRGVEARTDLGGIRLLSPEKGYKAIDELLGSDAAGQVMVAPWDLQQTPDWLRASPLLEDLLVSEDKSAHAVNTQFLHTYRATPRFQRRDLLADHLRQKLAMVLNIADESAITPTTAMFDLGLDSLTTIELKNAIRYSTGLDLPANLVFDFPTLDRLADEVHKRLQVEVGASSTEDEEIKRTESSGPPPSVHLATPPTEEAKDRQLEAAAGVWDDLAALEAELDSWEGT
ncbi:MAG: SDR family NAD(P)-dependent oxidoreductase [Planctomycetota bacterium]